MLLTLSNVLDETDLNDARDMVATLGWRDGAETAGASSGS